MRRGLSVKVDLGAAQHNVKLVRQHTGGLPLIAVVKADAYGHGAARLSRAFLEAGADTLAVAFISEARKLREEAIGAPVLVLFDSSEHDALFELNLTPVLHDLASARALSNSAQKLNTSIDIHLKLNTGMNRMGFALADELMEASALPGLKVAGFMSHFADADLADKAFSMEQVKIFRATKDRLEKSGLSPVCHMSNSAAALRIPEAWFDAVRPGIALYGASPFEDDPMGLKPVMSASAPVLMIRKVKKGDNISYGRTFTAEKDMLAAVVAAGYADGLPRCVSNKAEFIIRGKRAPIVGRVCMDLTLADVTHIGPVAQGDPAIILGSEGSETITAWELAGRADTIPYEILLALGRGAERTCP